VYEYRADLDHDAVLNSQARHLVVTAPPGTGKTCLSVRLAARLVPSVPSEGRILVLTFSTQARTQLEREAVRQLSPELRSRVEITNYHRFFWRQVLAYRRALGLPMRLDIGSRQRRRDALLRADSGLVKKLEKSDGLIESLAEHSFPDFQDRRTPDEKNLKTLLDVVEAEQRAGRLVFDDLGALFWSLLQRFPAVDQAYRSRYPAVIADEHQDASALQDAIVRRFGRDRLVVFADPMQLIHEFRGASRDRLEDHLTDCGRALTLGTPHRWHGSPELARWLLAVRARLEGERVPCRPPDQLWIKRSSAQRGFNGMKPYVKYAVSGAFAGGCRTVAVLARTNGEVAELRSYLCRQGQFPRQVGTEDFEDARQDIEQLPLLVDPQAVALAAIDRLEALVPTLGAGLLAQIRGRILPEDMRMNRAGREADQILRALTPIYVKGRSAYFESVATALGACGEMGHHLPRVEAVQALRVTAEAFSNKPMDFESAIDRYSAAVLTATYTVPRIDYGLFVMTAHQAKGKEFDAIILADAMERFWPDTEDIRRLFYVVVTRASKSWTMVTTDRGASPLLRYLLGA
jgi:hypothetical protein